MGSKILRIDKWLYFARIYRARNRAVKAIEKGLVFLNGSEVKKTSQMVKIGDGIIIKELNKIVQIKVVNFGAKRESYDIAKQMYENKIDKILAGAINGEKQVFSGSEYGSRPDKKERRALIKLKNTSNFSPE